ncbi:hypothetical protein [Stackebrandtia soli]|uniref:hypothetical protein n=1 Tax=Stackebrandtia soli TaxID=1892856 RepID=UPI0039E9A174
MVLLAVTEPWESPLCGAHAEMAAVLDADPDAQALMCGSDGDDDLMALAWALWPETNPESAAIAEINEAWGVTS